MTLKELETWRAEEDRLRKIWCEDHYATHRLKCDACYLEYCRNRENQSQPTQNQGQSQNYHDAKMPASNETI